MGMSTVGKARQSATSQHSENKHKTIMPYVPIRLSQEELEALDALIARNDTTGYENRSEVFRLLLHREVCRCKGLPKPKESEWRTIFRIGAKKKGEV